MNHKISITLSSVFLLFSLNILAADAVDVKRCSLIVSDLRRLACYDQLANGLPANLVVPPVTAQTPNSVASAQKDPTPRDTFGLESVIADDSPDSIVSTIVGEFDGWSGKTTFTLANGQIWKQSNSGKVVFHATDPQVTISKSVFGSYKLEIEGLNKTVNVRRVK